VTKYISSKDNPTFVEIIEAANLFKKMKVNNNPYARSQPYNKYGAYSVRMHGVGY
jgi:hypothetical protein